MVSGSFPWGAFTVFAIVSSTTPGPNVVMLTSSGSAWGFKKSLPLLLGICFGFPLMFLIVQFGANEAFARVPWLFPLLTLLSLIYILWLAVRLFKTGFNGQLELNKSERPFTFMEITLFQWINGKAWQIVISAATIYPSTDSSTKFLTALIFIAVLFVCGSLWIEVGKRISRYLENPTVRKVYYAALAIALILSTVPAGIAQLKPQIHLLSIF